MVAKLEKRTALFQCGDKSGRFAVFAYRASILEMTFMNNGKEIKQDLNLPFRL